MEQWFVDVNKEFPMEHSEIPGIESGTVVTLKSMMRAAVEHGGISMPQNRFSKTYFNWIDNLHDWCISRQIWFGHRIPVWYKDGEVYCDITPPTDDGWEQDPDVLDTWFSSALWTFSTLGWPEQTADLQTYHPTQFMSPAYEILPLWVSRMILMSGFHLGQVPFDAVMIHGLVRDNKGRKFSKSLGNGVDPLDMIGLYGADALRMGLMMGSAIGGDISFDERKIKGQKKFANKLWNITRFVLENTAGYDGNTEHTPADQAYEDKHLHPVIAEVTKGIEDFRLDLAADKLYHFVWDHFASEVIEESKPLLANEDPLVRSSRQKLLLHYLSNSLRMLHPFMPYITEAIWQEMPETIKDSDMLIVAKWPEVKK